MLMDKERLPSLSSFSRVSVALAHMSQLPLDARMIPLDCMWLDVQSRPFTLGWWLSLVGTDRESTGGERARILK